MECDCTKYFVGYPSATIRVSPHGSLRGMREMGLEPEDIVDGGARLGGDATP